MTTESDPGGGLREIRESRKLTQVQLSVKADVSVGVVQRAERDPFAVELRNLKKLADALGVPIWEAFPELKPDHDPEGEG